LEHIDARLPLEADDLVVGCGDHGDAVALRRDLELADDAALVNHLLLAPALQVKLPDLRHLAGPVAVLDVLEALPQILPLIFDLLDADLVEELFAIARQVERLDAVGDASDGQEIAAVAVDAPDLCRTIVGRLLLGLALAAAEEVDR